MNRGPVVPLDHKILDEVYSGKKVKLSHLRIFGCVAYVHISDQGMNKVDPNSKKCTFISYGEDEFGYYLWDNENKKMIYSRDVIFNERVMYKDTNNTNTSNSEQSSSVYAEVDDVPKTLMIETSQLEESIEYNSQQQVDTPEPVFYFRSCI